MKNMPISAMIGLFFTGLYFLMALFAPLLAPYGMSDVVGDVWEPSLLGYHLDRILPWAETPPEGTPVPEYWLGTDNIGRDLLTRMIYGGQTTIWIATAATRRPAGQ